MTSNALVVDDDFELLILLSLLCKDGDVGVHYHASSGEKMHNFVHIGETLNQLKYVPSTGLYVDLFRETEKWLLCGMIQVAQKTS